MGVRGLFLAAALSAAAFGACGDEAPERSESSVADASATGAEDGALPDAGSTVDAPSQDAGADGASPGDSATVSCGPDGTPCSSALAPAGLCRAGQCAACDEVLDQTACATAYGDAGPHVCAAGKCTLAECSATAPCPSGKGCAAGTCVACDVPTGNTYVVDPALGGLTATGSGAAGGSPNAACAFRTLRQANLAIAAAAGDAGAAPLGTKVILRGPVLATPSVDEPFPISLAANVTLEGENDGGLQRPASLAPLSYLVNLAAKGVRLKNLTVDGTLLPSDGGTTQQVCVQLSGTGTLALEGVDIRRCNTGVMASDTSEVSVRGSTVREHSDYGLRATSDAKITVSGSAGAVAIRDNGTGLAAFNTSTMSVAGGASTIDITGNSGAGLHVLGSATGVVTGGAAPITFRDNPNVGIAVQQDGKLVVTGDAAARNVVVTQTTSGDTGVRVRALGGKPTAEVTGLVVEKHSTGLFLNTSTAVKLRGSEVLGNTYGVIVVPAGVAQDMSQLDLGTDLASNAGGNTLQSTSNPNTRAGLCLFTAANQGQTLNARGNKWVSGDAGVDCTTSTAKVGPTSATCTGAANVGGSGVVGNTVRVDGCSLN